MEDRISQIRGVLAFHNIRRRVLAGEMNLHPKYIGAVLQGRERCPADFPQRVETAVCSIVARRLEHAGTK